MRPEAGALRFMRKFSWEMIGESMIKGDGNDIMSMLHRENHSVLGSGNAEIV